MAEEVFLSEGKLVGRGPTSGIPRTALAGGDELFFAEITGAFSSSSTSFIDVTGLSGTMTVPEGPYIVEFLAPVASDTANQDTVCQVLGGSTLLGSDSFRSPSAFFGDTLYLKIRCPYSMHTAAVGSTVTYKVQMKSSTTAAVASVVADFLGSRVGPAYIRAQRV